jgi:hypothetical protein
MIISFGSLFFNLQNKNVACLFDFRDNTWLKSGALAFNLNLIITALFVFAPNDIRIM